MANAHVYTPSHTATSVLKENRCNVFIGSLLHSGGVRLWPFKDGNTIFRSNFSAISVPVCVRHQADEDRRKEQGTGLFTGLGSAGQNTKGCFTCYWFIWQSMMCNLLASDTRPLTHIRLLVSQMEVIIQQQMEQHVYKIYIRNIKGPNTEPWGPPLASEVPSHTWLGFLSDTTYTISQYALYQ